MVCFTGKSACVSILFLQHTQCIRMPWLKGGAGGGGGGGGAGQGLPSYGSMLELSWRGARDIPLGAGGETVHSGRCSIDPHTILTVIGPRTVLSAPC
jgi:hypothetical protein